MALKIRLARAGSEEASLLPRRRRRRALATRRPFHRAGRLVESVVAKGRERIKIDADRIKYWMSHGALPTDRVLRFLEEAGIAKRETRSNPKKAEPGKKAQERLAAIKKAQDDAAAAIAATTAAPAEAPAEEAAAS